MSRTSAPRTATLLSCIVPAYNEAENLVLFIPAMTKKLQDLNLNFEIIVVNDGSKDNTSEVLQQLVKDYQLTAVEFSRNFGKEAAITAGLDQVNGDLALLIDADFQHPLDTIDTMLELWQAGYDMVYGIRDRGIESPMKRWLTHGFYWLMNKSAAIDMPPSAGDFRLMDRKVVDALQDLPERTRYMKGLYAWVGFKSIGVNFSETERLKGESSFNWFKLMSLAFSGITSFSVLPLRLCMLVGIVIALVALGYGGWIFSETVLEGARVPGWATLATGMMFLGGIQLLFLGIVGEYVSRVYQEVKARPRYIIANKLQHDMVKTTDSHHSQDSHAGH